MNNSTHLTFHMVTRASVSSLVAAFFYLTSPAQAASASPSITAASAEMRFNFSHQTQPGATNVNWNDSTGAPLFDAKAGYGFIEQTGAFPARVVHTAQIRSDGNGFVISEPAFEAEEGFGKDHYNNFGMAFRIKAAPGAYAIRVRTTSDASDTTVSVSGMQASRLTSSTFWDAAGLLPNLTRITTSGKDWSYRYVNGQQFIDIEIEPKKLNTPVGVEEIIITPIPAQARPANVLPTIYTLGDSTMKSYTFDEAPMSGWGQVFGQLFDLKKVRIVNYAQGGRSFRSAYSEGRFNDLLMSGYMGDIVLIQFGHNDESQDEMRRLGRGATEAMYEAMIRDVYLPAIRARGMLPVLVTPMSRVNGAAKPDYVYVNSFNKRHFPDLMKKIGAELGITVIDLNSLSVEYFNQNGVVATTAMVMSLEAGETPGKTNDGSYANGHPAQKIDGTHFKESMAKQYARIVATELVRLGKSGDPLAAHIAASLRGDVQSAIAAKDWSTIYPEIAKDIASGENAYYRNQIEKLLQLGVLHKDAQGYFNPAATMQTSEFITALCTLMQVQRATLTQYADAPLTLTREVMSGILVDAYHARFTSKPKYMTAYNGKTLVPGMSGYDPNLDSGAKGAMYYPLVSWNQLTDAVDVSPAYLDKFKDAYELGLIRSEAGIARGRMINGKELQPKLLVSRAKAAKALYFMWVLAQPPQRENDSQTLQ
ncbi:GDSL-type esterase/lipase family protein [Undibacterium sp. Di26W]|uniref:GDSL-type esterase/lipase family protein n=1 Tax=Undibacterium sp. Di26W TaxID=3413035 RepID=UPI003BF3B5A1